MAIDPPTRSPVDRPLPSREASGAFVVLGYLLDDRDEPWCEVRAIVLEHPRSPARSFTPALAFLPAFVAPWDSFEITELERRLLEGEKVESRDLTRLLQISGDRLKELFADAPGIADTLLHEWRQNRRIDERIAADPFPSELTSNWEEFSSWVTSEVQSATGSSDADGEEQEQVELERLRELMHVVPWAFFVPAVAEEAARWAGLQQFRLQVTSEAVLALTRLRWARASGSKKGPRAPRQPPVLSLEASLLFKLRRLQSRGIIKDAPRLYRAIVQSTSPRTAPGDPWRKHYKRVSSQVKRVERKVARWQLMPLAVPFPSEPLSLVQQEPTLDELAIARKAAIKEWAARESTKLALLVFAGGDPAGVQAFPSGVAPVTSRRSC